MNDSFSGPSVADREIPISECDWVRREDLLLASYAMYSKHSRGRRHYEPRHAYRSPFQRDRDRVLHSSAFRRLSGKMQVFTGDMGDYHRTRLTHTQEVATIARTIGRVLRLNEDLIEALALLHDIGHPPYGHSGEAALDACLSEDGGFSHNQFAVVLAEQLETRYTPYPGMNLTAEVLAGQGFRIHHGMPNARDDDCRSHATCEPSPTLTHSSPTESDEPRSSFEQSEQRNTLVPILEVQLVDLADSIAYSAHDVDDALTLGLLEPGQLSGLDLVRRAVTWGQTASTQLTAQASNKRLVHSLVDVLVADVVEVSREKLTALEGLDHSAVRQLETRLELSPTLASEKEQLSEFLFEYVYRHPKLMTVRKRASERVEHLFRHLKERPEMLPTRFQDYAQRAGLRLAVGHYIAGMTDRFCDARYRDLIELGREQAVDW